MMRAYLLEANSGHLLPSLPYETSDPSEKTSISYYLGMTLAKLFAEVLFGVPRMLHVAVYGQNYQIATGPGASRPDLIGLSANGDWFVFEAKGRSHGLDNGALSTAKDQAQQVMTIDNTAPLCRIASQSFFSTNGLRFRMDDPEPRDGSQLRNLKITRDEFVRAYYSPIRRILESRSSGTSLLLAGRRIHGMRIEEADITIALSERDESKSNDTETAQPSSREYLGRDGVLIRLGDSWNQENMILQPYLRSN